MINFQNDILPDFLKEDFFKDFKYRKNDNALTFKTKLGYNRISFHTSQSYDGRLENSSDYSLSEGLALKIYPVYGVRFNIIHKWFEKFSYKSLSDQRDNYTIGVDGQMLNRKNEYLFMHNGYHLSEDKKLFVNEIIQNAQYFFNRYETIKQYYINDVLPVLNKQKMMSEVGADWIFEYLATVKIVDSSRFFEMVEILKAQIEIMNNYGEPNLSRYYNQIDGIFNSLYEYDL
jgi:hypothetical protein